MKEFFDTSVLISAFCSGPQHQAGLTLVSAANQRSACAVLPVKDVSPCEQVLLFVQEVRDRFTIITLTEDDYFKSSERAAHAGLPASASMMLCFLRSPAKAKPRLSTLGT
jgi:hypothetical protein